MDFAAMFQTWMNVLTKPGEPVFQEESQSENATIVTALIWMVIAGAVAVVGGLISAAISSLFGGAATFASFAAEADLPPEVAAQLAAVQGGGYAAACFAIFLVPIVFLIVSSIHFATAKALGGTGSFEKNTYILATFWAPIGIVYYAFSWIPLLGLCIWLVTVIYQHVLTYFSMKVVHGLDTVKAIIVTIVPVLIMLLCSCGIGIAIASLFGAAIGSSGGF